MAQVEIDLGNLLVQDNEFFDQKNTTKIERTKSCCQAIFNELSKLAAKVIDQTTVVELPEPMFLLPREKHVPKERTETKWDKFAKMKNIKKKKKPKFAFNEEKGKYMPTWGKGSKDKAWVMEVSEHGDVNENKFAKEKALKRQRIEENETKRLKNLGRSLNVTMTSFQRDRKKDTQQMLKVANISDASMGKFSREVDATKLRKDVSKEFNKNQKKNKPKKSLIRRKPMKNKGTRTGKKKN